MLSVHVVQSLLEKVYRAEVDSTLFCCVQSEEASPLTAPPVRRRNTGREAKRRNTRTRSNTNTRKTRRWENKKKSCSFFRVKALFFSSDMLIFVSIEEET